MSTATAPKADGSTDRSVRLMGRALTLPTLDVTEATKPLFAVVGVADLALEQVKDVPGLYAAEARRVTGRLAEVPAAVRTLPASVKGLRDDVEATVERATGRAGDLYGKLALRGERLVTSIRRQPATEAAIAEGKEAVKKAEAAAVAARLSATAGGKAVRGAASRLG